MANKPFSIQESKLRIAGVDLEAGNTSVVIPGVTQATNYRVEEVEETGVDQTLTFVGQPVTIIDAVTYTDYLTTGASIGRATYTLEYEDGGSRIDEINVGTGGAYTPAEATTNATTDMWVTDYPGDPFAVFDTNVWAQIPFRPKMRAGEVENIGGGNGDTGSIRFINDVISHEDQGDGTEVGIQLNPNVPVAKMFVDSNRSWTMYQGSDYALGGAVWSDNGQGGGVLALTNITQYLYDVINELGQYKSAVFSFNGNSYQYNGWGGGGTVGVDAYFNIDLNLGPNGDPVTLADFNINAVFENRFVLDADEGDYGIWANSNVNIRTSSGDINLYADDDFRIEGTDLLQIRNKSLDGGGIDLVTRYSSNTPNVWEFTDSGILNVPTVSNRIFTAVLNAAHYVGGGEGFNLPQGATPWSFPVEFVTTTNGTVETVITNNTPFTDDPGYAVGQQFSFYSQDHNIPNYTFTLTITDIQYPGPLMVTVNLAASFPPDYPNTIYSGSTIKLTAADKTWRLGADGKLYFPDGSFQSSASVGTGTTGDVTFSFNKIFGTNNSLILKAYPDDVYNSEWGVELFNSYDNDTHFRPLTLDKGIALGFGYGSGGSHIRVEGRLGQGGVPNTGNRVGIVAASDREDAYYYDGADFSNQVLLDDAITFIPGLTQRNETEIEVSVFALPSSNVYNRLTGLVLGDVIEITYNTLSNSKKFSAEVSQTANTIGQVDPANPTWSRIAFRVLGTVPVDYISINNINAYFVANTSAEWIFDNNGLTTYPNGTKSSGNTVLTATNSDFNISTSRLETAVAQAFIGTDGQIMIADITANDDITVVQAGWQINAGTPEAPVWLFVATAFAGAGFYSIEVPGFTFELGSVYTFRNPTPVGYDWFFTSTGELTTPGNGSISHLNNDLKLEVSGSDVIVLRTGGGDLVLASNGHLDTPGELTVGGQTYTTSAILWQNGTGAVINNNAIDEYFIIATNTNTGTQRNWKFGWNGNLSFPDNTIQTTAWSGGRVVAVPAHSTGAVGDQQGDLAFDNSHIYYCIANYNQLGHQVAVSADYLGRTTLNTNGFQLTRTVDTLQITPGDIISDSNGGATSTVVSVTSDENYVYVNTGVQAFDCVFPLTFTSTDFVSGGNIWKRIAWGGDTW